MSNDDIDKLFGRLHDLADLDVIQLQANCNKENLKFVHELVTKYWRGRSVPMQLSTQEFSDLVYSLRNEEKEWSKKLGAMLIASEDRISEGNKEKVVEYFEYFLEHCPCKALSSIAEIEKDNFGI